MRVLLLVAVTAAGCAAAVGVASWTWGPDQVRPAVLAAALCLAPAVASLSLVEWVARRAPAQAAVAVLLGIGLRMAVVVAGVLIVTGGMTDPAARDRFVGWVVAMYLLTLAAESALAAHAVRAADRPAPPAGGR